MANFGDIPSNQTVATTLSNEGFGLGQIVGVTDLSDAAAGNVGESSTSNINTPGTSLSTGTPINLFSISTGAGDWDFEGHVTIAYTSATQSGDAQAGINTISATLPPTSLIAYNNTRQTTTTSNITIPIARRRITQNSTNTIYVVVQATFSAGTATAAGFINKRRVR